MGVGYVFVPDGQADGWYQRTFPCRISSRASSLALRRHQPCPLEAIGGSGNNARSRGPEPFWRTFFLLALLLVGSILAGCRRCGRWV